MNPAYLRLSIADLRQRPFQSLMLLVVLAASALTLTMAVYVLRGVDSPWERTFNEANGAHVWYRWITGAEINRSGTSTTVFGGAVEHDTGYLRLAELVADANPQAMTELQPITTFGTVELVGGNARGIDLTLFGQHTTQPEMGGPLLVSGRWIANDDEIVLDRQFDVVDGVREGGQVTLAIGDDERTFTAVGFTVDPNLRNALNGFVTRDAIFASVDPADIDYRLGVRLAEPLGSREFSAGILAQFPGSAPILVRDWQWVLETSSAQSRVIGLFLGVFSIFALIAAGLIVVNSTVANVLARSREFGLLKAVGFTPRQVLLAMIGEHVAVATVALAVGIAAAVPLGPAMLEDTARALRTPIPSLLSPIPIISSVVVVLLVVAFSASFAARRASRVSVSEAVASPRGIPAAPRSWLVRTVDQPRLGVAARMGLRDAASRPTRLTLTLVVLLLGVATLTFTAGVRATLGAAEANPAFLGGEPSDAELFLGDIDRDALGEVLERSPNVDAWYMRSEVTGVRPDVSLVILSGLSGDHAAFPRLIVDGRLFKQPGEVLISSAMSNVLGIRVGNTFDLQVDGQAIELEVVGTYLKEGNDGRSALTSRETLTMLGLHDRVDVIGVRFSDTGTVSLLRTEIAEIFDQGVRMSTPPDVAKEAAEFVWPVIGTMSTILAGLIVLSVFAMIGFNVRERQADLAVLRAVGLTPRQIVGGILAGAGALAVIGVVIGIPLGMIITTVLYDAVAEQTGLGKGIGVMPDVTSLLVVALACAALVVVSAYLPARRATAFPVSAVLRED